MAGKSIRIRRSIVQRKSIVGRKSIVTLDEEEESDEEDEGPTLRKQFVAFVKYKNEQNPGTHILLSQSDFWMEHAGVIKGRTITKTDTGTLADFKKVMVDEIIDKLVNCGPPPQETNVNVGMPR